MNCLRSFLCKVDITIFIYNREIGITFRSRIRPYLCPVCHIDSNKSASFQRRIKHLIFQSKRSLFCHIYFFQFPYLILIRFKSINSSTCTRINISGFINSYRTTCCSVKGLLPFYNATGCIEGIQRTLIGETVKDTIGRQCRKSTYRSIQFNRPLLSSVRIYSIYIINSSISYTLIYSTIRSHQRTSTIRYLTDSKHPFEFTAHYINSK